MWSVITHDRVKPTLSFANNSNGTTRRAGQRGREGWGLEEYINAVKNKKCACHPQEQKITATSTNNFLYVTKLRRPQIDPRKYPESLSDAEFHVDFISEVPGGVSLDAEALQVQTCVTRRVCMV